MYFSKSCSLYPISQRSDNPLNNKSKVEGNLPSPLGNRIKALRQANNMSQQLLAEQLDVSHAYIGFLEKGTRSGSNETLEKIAQFFQIDSKELFDLKDQKNDMVHFPKSGGDEGKGYPAYIEEFADMLNKIEETACKKIIEEFQEQLQKKLYNYLTPYELKSVKQLVQDVKRAWLRLIQQAEIEKSLCKELQGYINQSDKEIFFHFQVDESALVISLLYPDQSQITTFENWIGEYSIRFIRELSFVHLSQPQKVSSFIWFSPSLSTVEKYHYLVNNQIKIDKLECSETQLDWYIQQHILEHSNDASAS